MENYIMFEGKKIPLTDEQIAALKTDNAIKNNPFERQDGNGCYYYIDSWSDIIKSQDGETKWDDAVFDVANYCTDKELMKQRALHEILNRLLWRRSMQDGEGKRPWNAETKHYSIEYDCSNNRLFVYKSYILKNAMIPYFPSYKSAKHAIEEIVKPFMKEHPEFVW